MPEFAIRHVRVDRVQVPLARRRERRFFKEAAPVPEMTPYHQIAEFVGWLRNATASDDEVEHHLRILEADLGLWADKLRSIQIPTDTAGESGALIEDSLQGLDLFHTAIAHVRDYIEMRSEESADAALSEARQGVELILRVKGVTEENIERILDEAGQQAG